MHLRNISGRWRVAVLSALALFCTAEAIAQPLTLSPIGKFALAGGAPTGLSGLTYAGGSQFYAVEDSGARMFPLTIAINSTTGAINSATVGSLIQLTGDDLEGVAYNAINNSVYVSDEAGPGIREYNLTGTQISTVTVPTIYDNIRSNQGLESLALQAGHQSMWTANQQALTVDGSKSSTSSGTTVRLQKFDSLLTPDGQWAYLTDTITNSFPSSSSEKLGVAEIMALPNGKVLVLERQADAFIDVITPSLRYKNRIYEVDFSTATDVSELAGLAGEQYIPVAKTLLWDSPWFEEGDRDNFEGMTLGPQLANGDYSVLLISDGDNSAGFAHGKSLYALRLGGGIHYPGDYNFDGTVDAADYTVWRDGNSPDSSSVGYNLWADNFGNTQGASSTTSVPEPTTALLMSCLLSPAFICRRRAL